MSTVENDLTSFNDFVRKYLAGGGEKSWSIKELFDLWRGEHVEQEPLPNRPDEIRQAINEYLRGVPGKSADEHLEELRQRYGFCPQAALEKALNALKKQEDRDAIREGLEDYRAGRTMPFAEADRQIRQKLIEKYGLPLGDHEI